MRFYCTLLLLAIIAGAAYAQGGRCRQYNSLQMAGLKGRVQSMTRTQCRAKLVNGRWETEKYPTISVTTRFDSSGWMITDSTSRLLDDGVSYMERECRLFARYPAVHIITDAPHFRSRMTTSLTWLSDRSYRLDNVADIHTPDSNIVKPIAYTLVSLDEQCRRTASDYYIINRKDTVLSGSKQIGYGADSTTTTSKHGIKEYAVQNTWRSISLERDSHGNVTRLLSHVNGQYELTPPNGHYELTIYTYTYY